MRVPRLTTWCGLAALAVLCATVGISVGCSGPADQGRELEQAGDLEGAILYYEAALREDPDDVELLAALASDLALLGRHDQALPVQERVVELDHEDVQTRLELGFNYLNHQKDRAADAVRILSEAALLEPTAQHLTFKAQAQILLGDDEGAERTLLEAVESEPEYGFSYTVLHSLLVSRGAHEEAARVEDQALLHGIHIGTQ